LVIEAGERILQEVPRGQILKVKLEVDTDPPAEFRTEAKYLLQPIPFAVRTYVLPDLFAGKMHALLCRRWKGRVKGRDWYDFVWFVANHPELHLAHLEQRMRQSGHWKGLVPLTEEVFKPLLVQAIEKLDVSKARKEVEPFLKQPEVLAIWSKDFFGEIATQIRFV
jgi:hypothetical protein